MKDSIVAKLTSEEIELQKIKEKGDFKAKPLNKKILEPVKMLGERKSLVG